MADLDIAIAGRNYRVACADGEEDNLTRAAALLAEEAETLRAQFGGRFAALPESRVLLMASLMLGDRFRATLDAGAAEPGALAAEPAEPAAGQPGFFDDPELAARVEALEAELAEAREAEAAAVAALEDAAARVRMLSAEIREDAEEEDEEDDGEGDDDLDADDGPVGAALVAAPEMMAADDESDEDDPDDDLDDDPEDDPEDEAWADDDLDVSLDAPAEDDLDDEDALEDGELDEEDSRR